MNARNQYLKVLQGKYSMAKSGREKSAILDEYCSNTGQKRKYMIRKIISRISLAVKRRRRLTSFLVVFPSKHVGVHVYF